MAVGLAGVVAVVAASLGLMAVDGLGLIIWFAWLGVFLLRQAPAERIALPRPAMWVQPAINSVGGQRVEPDTLREAGRLNLGCEIDEFFERSRSRA